MKNARVLVGAVIIKHKLTLSDEETVQRIQENPYLQYFIGLSRFLEESSFAPCLFVEIRRRDGQCFCRLRKSDPDDDGKSRKKQKSDKEDQDPPSHKGKLVIDVTVAELASRYPNEL